MVRAAIRSIPIPNTRCIVGSFSFSDPRQPISEGWKASADETWFLNGSVVHVQKIHWFIHSHLRRGIFSIGGVEPSIQCLTVRFLDDYFMIVRYGSRLKAYCGKGLLAKGMRMRVKK